MRKQHFIWQDDEHNNHYVYEWLPLETIAIKGIVQIAHGMAETAERYERLAEVLTKRGYAVYANDHLGHGRTAGTPDAVGKFGKNSFERMVDNMGKITGKIRERYTNRMPLFVMGHSMGSFLTQSYMGTYLVQFPDHVQGIILSGSNGSEGAALNAGIALATAEAAIRGDHHRSSLLTSLSFGAYNKKFAPNRTSFDWLSTDKAEVDKYMDDPYCGVMFTSGFFQDFFRGLKAIHHPAHVQRIPKKMPVYIFSGEEDPVGGHGKGVRRLIRMYQELGLTKVSSKLYPGGRHEMLNEVNREEVMADLAGWLDQQVGEERR
ncbi:alpha/beta fold hydrolase [Paenibacillus planticolens]|uniref:Alpha/beta fold hydrolase n=1 Tax=Paenibacillus planticolens TaxID=2654976 RepID=A0ABX1ZFU9_9BACL|nr:alpha/beta fold hydrolase [Paenibacillus planticolens]NOU98978.1 alpha/beta fold hydrolase [Paenibacillus planticolens]